MKDNNDELIDRFFSQASKTEIADGGFSDSVMRNIQPLAEKRLLRLSALWTAVCWFLGISIFIYTDMLSSLIRSAVAISQDAAAWANGLQGYLFSPQASPLLPAIPLAVTVATVAWCVAEDRKFML